MKSVLVVGLGLLCAGHWAEADQQDDLGRELGEAIVQALRDEDIVAYSQCWISDRRIVMISEQARLALSQEQRKAMRAQFLKRNRSIAESYNKIQTLIDEKGIDRQTIKFLRCDMSNVKEKKAGEAVVTRAAGAKVFWSAGEDEWKLCVTDCIVDGGMWHLTGRPYNLWYEGDETLGFRDHENAQEGGRETE